jgi:hypothetical protein
VIIFVVPHSAGTAPTSWTFVDSSTLPSTHLVIQSTDDTIVVSGDAVLTTTDPQSGAIFNIGISVTNSTGSSVAPDPGTISTHRVITAAGEYEFAVNGVITGLAPGDYYVDLSMMSDTAFNYTISQSHLTAYVVSASS